MATYLLNKLTNPTRISGTCLLIIFLTVAGNNAFTQDSAFKRPPVISQWREYRQLVQQDSSQKMVELKSMMPALLYDLRYATENNFMHRRMYDRRTTVTFLRLPVARALQLVQHELAAKGMGLKIFDAYRPYAVTVKFWELVKDERYVANPAKGSGHNRGIAIDLTIIDKATGKELDMGTGFDNFTDTAHHTFTQLSPTVLQNRQLLRSTMEKYGFKALESEWWHYFIPEASRFAILDIPFRKLAMVNKQ
jgi:D-alanyl-D-alanine dipeptidase